MSLAAVELLKLMVQLDTEMKKSHFMTGYEFAVAVGT